MEKYSTYHIKTDIFEKVLIGMLHMIQTVPPDTKCRIVLDYDPALPKVTIETFIDKSDVERVQERFSRSLRATDIAENCWLLFCYIIFGNFRSSI